MALPEQIRKQAEAVQELYKQLNTDDNTGTGESQSADGTVPPVETQPADEKPAPNTAAQAPANEQTQGADNVSEETMAQKYRTLQGMYNAEVPRLHQQNRELTNRIQQMEQLLASMSNAQAQPAAAQPAAERFISEKEVEEYGDSIDVMRRAAREEVSAILSRLSSVESALQQMRQVVPQVQAVAQRQQVTAEQQFWADLAAAVPNYRQVNDNPDFQSWLLSPDPLTGITRQTYLDDAQRALDARRVANFFRAWQESTGQVQVAQSTGNAATPAAELEKQVAPGRSRSAGNPASASQAKTYTPQDITKFFNDVRAGRYKGKEQERSRIERDIFAAQREGRIQMNA